MYLDRKKMRFYRFYTRKQFLLFWAVILIVSVFYNEYLIYKLNSYTWLKPKCTYRNDCTKILFVADPQIIGKYREIIHFLTPFTTYDSDMYLKNTYINAFNFINPDIVIYLGDLMDEGSIADDKEFYEYVRRLFNIFLYNSPPTTKHIWLPGDNDIGGEGSDFVTPQKLKRFNRAFSQPELINHKNITFFKINRLIDSIPVYKKNREFYDTTKIFVGLSHMPLVFMPSIFVNKVFDKMLPHVLFTAHEHKSMIITTDALLRQDRQIVPVMPDNHKIFQFELGTTNMYEFIVPTCSYRMGTDKIGFGYAILEKNELRYTVLWSPSRFNQLVFYLIIAICFISTSLCLKCGCIPRSIKFTCKR